MSDNVSPIVSKPEVGNTAYRAQAGHVKSAQQADASAAVSGSQTDRGSQPVEDPQASKKPVVNNSLVDVSLKFEIDAQTKDVTIMLLDRASRRVLRTIPAQEMTKLDPGELVSLFT